MRKKETENFLVEEEEKVPRSYMMELLIALMVFAMLVVYFWDRIVINVPSGHRGVLFRALGEGTVTDKSWGEGLTVIFPWDKMDLYDIKILAAQDTIHALTQDGLSVHAEISYRYVVKLDSLGWIHKNVGTNYKETIIIPHVTASTRDVISRYRVDALFTTGRKDIQEAMLTKVKNQVNAIYPITIIDLLVRNIAIDKTVEQSIANKLVKEQEMLGYDFILKKEMKEKDRKIIEAQGIQAFRNTSGISILQWKGIEATKELATSANAKVIVIGSGKDGLPIILGGN